MDKAPAAVYHELLDEGLYLCSISTMYRILREYGEVTQRRRQATHPARIKPELVATKPNVCWSWDITKLPGPAKWSYFYLYVVLDIYSRYVVGWTLADAEALREEIAGVLTPVGLRLSSEKTLITHIDEGLVFLGWHIQRHRKRGTNRYYVYTYPSRKALAAVMAKVKTLCRKTGTSLPLDTLLIEINRMIRGWCEYFRPGVSSATFQYLSSHVWKRVMKWLKRKHRRTTWTELRRRCCGGRWWPASNERELFDPAKVRTTRYRYRGTVIPSPWPATR